MSNTTIDKERAEPDIIDNRTHTMADVLNMNLGRIGFLDVSSGYFEVSGYGAIRRNLERAISDDSFRFRLLVGKDALRPTTLSTFEEYRQGDIHETLQSSLDTDDFDTGTADDVAGLMELLGRDNVQVRLGRSRFNHAKCYILGQEGAIIGSSNFTGAGLSGNDELNAGIFVTSTWGKVREWYERMWGGARDAKADMLCVLEQSKFGVPASPYDIYLKMLFEKYRRALTAMGDTNSHASELPKFQQDAVSVILQTISEHGGAMLADSTGLGKTHIGLEVMRRKMAEKRRILLIAPAQVMDTVWDDRLDDVQIRAKTISIENLGRRDFDIFKYARYDFVVIDESQNFRSRATGRRQNLMRLLSLGRKKQVLLMSATPVNNSLMDLYYQVSIITGERDDHFADMGIPDLYYYMRRAANHRMDEGLEKIQLLLEAIMVRRTRTFIREVYPDETLDGRPVTFPKRTYRPIKYGMTETFGNIYQDLLDTISTLNMTPYGIEMYNKTLTDEARRRHRVLAHLQIILLLKRFESSISAVTASLDNKIRLFEHFGRLLAGGRIISPRDLNRVMLKWNAKEIDGSEPDDAEFLKEVMGLQVRDAGDYDTDMMARHVKSDLVHLKRYLKSLGKAREDDKKAAAVADTILNDGALNTGGHKVLVFTEYTATAIYVQKYLRERFPDKTVGLITGSMKKTDRPKTIRAFSPVSNDVGDEPPPDMEIDILVSTEVMSEGQNLQDCSYVINYDLPWNPMRLVQRIGRIDRLTSPHDTVHSRECFPDEKLDELLALMGKLYEKIVDINETVGLDADLLGQEASPKNFQGTVAGRLRVLAGDGDSDEVTEALERESDLMPVVSPFNEISRHIRKEGIMKMEEFPMGRRAGKAGESDRAVLAYVRRGQRRTFHSVVFDISDGTAEVVDDMEAIRLAKCGEKEEPYLPMDAREKGESFRMLLEMDGAAREAISNRSGEDERIAASLRSRPKKSQRIIEVFREAMDMAVDAGSITEREAEEADIILDSADMRQWGDYLTELLAGHGKDGMRRAITDLKRIGRDMAVREEETRAVAEPGKLVLVGVLFITGPDRGDSADWRKFR